MRHFISLGIRGVLMEFGGLLMRVQGRLSYQMLLRRNRNRQPQS
ncbi:MAG: hypothetical protein JWP89_2300 [Schlesneria sp.]|nr:hypothetical protein [Schlesneria sp.]